MDNKSHQYYISQAKFWAAVDDVLDDILFVRDDLREYFDKQQGSSFRSWRANDEREMESGETSL